MALDAPDTHSRITTFINNNFTATDKDLMQSIFVLSFSPWWERLTKGNATIDVALMKKYTFAQFVFLPIQDKWIGTSAVESIAGDVSRSLAINAQKLLSAELTAPSTVTVSLLQSCVADPIIVAAYSLKNGVGMGQLIEDLYNMIQILDTE
jgi:hypothetical protein